MAKIKTNKEIQEFIKTDILVGTVMMCQLEDSILSFNVNFGSEIGTKQSAIEFTGHFSPQSVLGYQILCKLNQVEEVIKGISSTFKVLMVKDNDNNYQALRTVSLMENGSKLEI